MGRKLLMGCHPKLRRIDLPILAVLRAKAKSDRLLELMPISADYFFGPGAELMQPTHLAGSVCAPYADGAHLTHSLPRLREGSIAE